MPRDMLTCVRLSHAKRASSANGISDGSPNITATANGPDQSPLGVAFTSDAAGAAGSCVQSSLKGTRKNTAISNASTSEPTTNHRGSPPALGRSGCVAIFCNRSVLDLFCPRPCYVTRAYVWRGPIDFALLNAFRAQRGLVREPADRLLHAGLSWSWWSLEPLMARRLQPDHKPPWCG